MAEPIVAQKSPYAIEVTPGRKYYWCACGRSSKQPFCDGSHKDTGLQPTLFEPVEAKKVFFCGCKHSVKKPFCDGTHNRI